MGQGGQYDGGVIPEVVSRGALVLNRVVKHHYGSAVVVLRPPAGVVARTLTLRGEGTGPWRMALGDRSAKTFTVDNTTEIFTSTAHGYENGDGPLKVSNSGGALPTGLLNTTLYYVHVIDADTFTLHLTRQDAIDGLIATAVTVSTNGTGTQTIGGIVATAIGASVTDGYGTLPLTVADGWVTIAAPRRLTVVTAGATDCLTYFYA